MGIAVASSEVDCSPLCVRAYCVWSEGVQQRSTKLELVKARAVANYVENTRAGGVFVLWVGVCFGYGSALKSKCGYKNCDSPKPERQARHAILR